MNLAVVSQCFAQRGTHILSPSQKSDPPEGPAVSMLDAMLAAGIVAGYFLNFVEY